MEISFVYASFLSLEKIALNMLVKIIAADMEFVYNLQLIITNVNAMMDLLEMIVQLENDFIIVYLI